VWQRLLRSLAVLAGASPSDTHAVAEEVGSLWTELPESETELDACLDALATAADARWRTRVDVAALIERDLLLRPGCAECRAGGVM